MKISEIDKNFALAGATDFACEVYDASDEPFTLYGGFAGPDRKFEKMPTDVARAASPGVLWGSGCGAGMRVTFSTDAARIRLSARIKDKCRMNHMAFMGSACFTLTEDRDGKSCFIGNFITSEEEGDNTCRAELALKGGKMRQYCLHFPLYSGVESLFLAFSAGSRLEKYEKYAGAPRVLYYGSSITQGGCASRADNSYQQLVSEWTGYDYTTLGFSGNAKAEDAVIGYLKDFGCDYFVCDYDWNAPTVEHLRNTHEKLYRAFRENPAHKDVPVIFLSKPDGRRDPDGEERFSVIRTTYEHARAAGDRVYLIDGREMYGEDVYEHCAVDGCHPTDLGFYFMAKAVKKALDFFRR